MSKLIDEVIRPFLDKEQLSEYGEKYYWPTTKIPYEKGTGYDSADKARGTIDSVKGKSKNYQSYVINSMYKRSIPCKRIYFILSWLMPKWGY